MTKSEIRKKMLKILRAQTKEERIRKDRIIREKFLSLPEFKEARTIAFYVSLASEVDTTALIDEALARAKRVVVPDIVGDDLEFAEIKSRKKGLAQGPYGILQPARDNFSPFPKEDIDLIVVPGVAFSRDGLRLGRGKGFYDRFLKVLPGRVRRIGLAYDFQIIEDLPITSHDSSVDTVITN